jgi:hypothetical protein
MELRSHGYSEGAVPQRVPIEPDASIPDLIGRLTDDSKRLVKDEIRLAKLETRESIRVGTRGVLWMSLAFGFGVVALVALTIMLAALIGRAAGGNYWVGALVTALVELAAGAWLIMRGVKTFGEPSYTLDETRREIGRTAAWIKNERAD